MIVYHGTDSISAENILKTNIDLKCGNEFVDNAKGFYTTPNKTFAMQRAKMAVNRVRGFHRGANVKPVVLEIELDLNCTGDLQVKEFAGCTYEWREFVFYNRLGREFLGQRKIGGGNHNLDAKYDVVIDETADARINDLVSDFKDHGNMDEIESVVKQIEKSPRRNWDKQISLHTDQAVKICVKSIQIMENEG